MKHIFHAVHTLHKSLSFRDNYGKWILHFPTRMLINCGRMNAVGKRENERKYEFSLDYVKIAFVSFSKCSAGLRYDFKAYIKQHVYIYIYSVFYI